jgi:tRNA threonylcarbamoyl adenosine modification protein YjeE
LATPDSIVVSLPTAADTHRFGRDRLAPLLEPGDLIIASGRLGAGKTALIQGIGAGLQVDGPVLSPTFVIARVHRGGRIPLIHVDAYRLDSIQEIDDLDLDTDLAQSVTAVEWGQGLVEHLTDEHLLIELNLPPQSAGSLPNRHFEGDRLPGDEFRTAWLTPYGPSWQARLSDLTA